MNIDAYGRERHEGDRGFGACDHYDPHAEAMANPAYAEMERRWREKHCRKPVETETQETPQ